MPQLNHFDYFSDIEKAFIRRRGKHLMIGPLDWSLIESWEKRGIPLKIVIQSIDEVFDSIEQRDEDKTRVRSLNYCSDAVERRFKEWSRSGVGRPALPDESLELDFAFSETEIKAHIGIADRALSELDPRIPQTVCEKLEKLRVELNRIEATNGPEEKLDRLDDEIDRLVLENSAALLNPALQERVGKKLAAFGIGIENKEAERVICWAIKDEYGIPRLSLYRL